MSAKAKTRVRDLPRTYCPACGNRHRVKHGLIVSHQISVGESATECPGTGHKPKKFQPDPRWPEFMARAVARISKAEGWGAAEPETQIAAEIVRAGEGEAFLKAVRRGRPTVRQNLRYRLLREVENAIGASVPRRREDRNTPEAAPRFVSLGIDGGFPDS